MMMHASPVLVWLTSVCYFVFAAQIAYQTNWGRVSLRTGIAFGALAVIFVFCGLTHVAGLFGQEWYLIREVMYLILASASVVLVLANLGKVISKSMEDK